MFAILAVILSVLALAIPHPVLAAGSPSFSIVKIVSDQSVTIRTANFPANQIFTVRMDVVGHAAVNGIIVTQTNSGAGGTFEETYRIPAELKGKPQIAIRLESASASAYNWFNNITSSTPSGNTSTTIPVTSGKGINIKIAGVDANNSVTIDAYNFPAHVRFKVRVGPFNNFWKGHEVLSDLDSGNGGNFRFTLGLPSVVRDVQWVSVRLDAYTGGWYVFNAFKNVDSAIIDTSYPAYPTYPAPIVTGSCELTSYAPQGSIVRNGEFDAKWTIKNTSDTTWRSTQVDYKFLGGTDMNKYDNRYDLPNDVKPGKSITIIVDMQAPSRTGWYSTTWGLVQGGTTLCRLPLSIQVK